MIDAWCVEVLLQCSCSSSAGVCRDACRRSVSLPALQPLAKRYDGGQLGPWQIKQIRQESLNDLHVEKFRSVHLHPVREGFSARKSTLDAANTANTANCMDGLDHIGVD